MDSLTVAGTIEDLRQRGFTDHFIVVGNELRALEAGKIFAARDLLIREHHRFEGVSDPDDMAVVYAIESRSGTRGTLTDGYGVYASAVVGAFLDAVRIEKASRPGS